MKYYEITFKYSASTYCSNICKAETVEDIRRHYNKYEIISLEPINQERVEYVLEDAQRRGKPVIDCEHTEEPETEEKPTETTQSAQDAESEDIMKNYRIEKNHQYNSTEIYFNGKPAEAIREALKALGCRWHGVKKCWYGRAEETAIIEAIEGKNGAQAAEPISKAPKTEKTEVFNLEGLEKNSCRGLYGTDLNKAIREDLKKRGISGVTIRGRRGSEITFTITMRPGDFRSAEECAARDCWSEFFRQENNWGFDLNGINYSHRNENREDETHKYIRCGSAWNDNSEGSNTHILRAFWFEKLKHFDPGHHFIGREVDDVRLTEAGKKRLDAIHKIIDSYNYDNSDSMTDYFDRGFYDYYDYKMPADFVPVEFMTPEEETALRAEKEAEKAAQEARFAELEREREEARKEEEKRREKEKADRETIAAGVQVVDIPENEQFFITGLIYSGGKDNTLEEVKEYTNGRPASEDAKISRRLEMTPEAFGLFCNMLLDDFDFLEGFGGTGTDDPRINDENLYTLTQEQRESVKFYTCNAVAVYVDNVLQFVIDPQGYGYARYILIPSESTTEHTPAENAEISEADAEKPAFYFPAAASTQAAGIEEGEEITLYKSDGWISNIVHTYAGTLEKVEPGTWAQYDGVYITIRDGRKAQRVFIKDNDRGTLIYYGQPEPLPDSVRYSSITRDSFGTRGLYRDNADQLKQIIKHYETRGKLPALDMLQR